MRRRLHTLLLAMGLLAPWALAAQTLTLDKTTAGATLQFTRSDCAPLCDQTVVAPLWARVDALGQFAEADAAAGTLRSLVETAPAASTVEGSSGANPALVFHFVNGDAAPIVLPAATFSLEYEATHATVYTPAAINYLMANTGVSMSTLVLPASGEPAFSFAAATQFDTQFDPDEADFPDGLSVDEQTDGGATLTVLENTSTQFHVLLQSGELTLAPGDQLTLTLMHGSGVNRYTEPGTWAMVDGSNTARFTARLPSGVLLDSAVPMAWVSAVPEPASAAMLLVGLLGLGAVACRRRHAAATRGDQLG